MYVIDNGCLYTGCHKIIKDADEFQRSIVLGQWGLELGIMSTKP